MILKDLCHLLLTTDLSNRDVAGAAGVSPNTARRYRMRLAEEGLSWPEVEMMTEAALDQRLNDGRERARKQFVEPDFTYVHAELRRVGVTLLLLHEEYAGAAGEAAMSETEFRRRYHDYQRSLGIVMRQPRAPGYELFLDFSGSRPSITNIQTGERTPVELFIAVIGASRKTFVYAVATQRLADWCEANARAMEFYEGVPTLLVPDNLKSAVDRVNAAEGHVINFTYSKLARHYKTIVMPARSRKPKDKAPVEIGVLLAKRYILARLRNRVFTSIEELNAAIAELTVRMNDKPMKGHGNKSRNQLFEELDRPALKPLPELPFEYADWKLNVTVAQDYHVGWDSCHYSVPYRYIGSKVRIRATARVIEVYHQNDGFPIATHKRSAVPGTCVTNPEHQPKSHQAYAQDQGAELIAWAERSGPSIQTFMQKHIDLHRRPALSLQAFKGLKGLAKQYGIERVDAACGRAMSISSSSVTSVRSMLQRGIERTPVRRRGHDTPPRPHDNVRGPQDYE